MLLMNFVVNIAHSIDATATACNVSNRKLEWFLLHLQKSMPCILHHAHTHDNCNSTLLCVNNGEIKDLSNNRNIMFGICNRMGKSEANIFAGNLVDVYRKYISLQGWKPTEMMSSSSNDDGGGCKLITLDVCRDHVYSDMKWKAGVHCVQRVPKTVTHGRVDTLTATVAIMPKCDKVEIKIYRKDIKIYAMRSGSAGGQNMNKAKIMLDVVRNLSQGECSLVYQNGGKCQFVMPPVYMEGEIINNKNASYNRCSTSMMTSSSNKESGVAIKWEHDSYIGIQNKKQNRDLLASKIEIAIYCQDGKEEVFEKQSEWWSGPPCDAEWRLHKQELCSTTGQDSYVATGQPRTAELCL